MPADAVHSSYTAITSRRSIAILNERRERKVVLHAARLLQRAAGELGIVVHVVVEPEHFRIAFEYPALLPIARQLFPLLAEMRLDRFEIAPHMLIW